MSGARTAECEVCRVRKDLKWGWIKNPATGKRIKYVIKVGYLPVGFVR